MISSLRSLPKRPPAEAIGELFYCDPYCESVGNIYAASPQLYENGLKIEIGTGPGVKRWKEAKPGQGVLRVLADPVRKSQMEALETHEPEEDDYVADSSEQKPGKRRPPSRWRAGAMVQLQLSSRSLSTDANTNRESDAKIHGIAGISGELWLRDFGTWGKRTLSSRTVFGYVRALSETPTDGSPDRSSSTQTLNLNTGVITKIPFSPWSAGLLLDGKWRTFNTKPETASGFSTQYLLVSLGIEVGYSKTTLQLTQSLFGVGQDSSTYRGTSLSASELALRLKSCKSLGAAFSGRLQICGLGDLEFLSVSGSGVPLRDVLTENPKHSYNQWKLGLAFGVTELSL